jgi:hypothetical protein
LTVNVTSHMMQRYNRRGDVRLEVRPTTDQILAKSRSVQICERKRRNTWRHRTGTAQCLSMRCAKFGVSYLHSISYYSTTHPLPGIFFCTTFLAGNGHPIPLSGLKYGMTQHSLILSDSPLFGMTALIGFP